MSGEPSAQTQGMLNLDADEVEVLLTHLAEMDVPGNYDAASEAVQEDAPLLVKLYRAQSALLDAATERAERAEAACRWAKEQLTQFAMEFGACSWDECYPGGSPLDQFIRQPAAAEPAGEEE